MTLFPIPAGFYRMNCADAYSNGSCYVGKGYALFYQHPDKNNVPFIKNGSTIFRSFVSLMFDSIINIFIRCSVAKIGRSIVIPVPINMTNDRSIRSFAIKGFGNHRMYGSASLGFVLWSFFQRNSKIVRCRVGLANKSFAISDRGNPTKVANFISIMSDNGFPYFRGISHG